MDFFEHQDVARRRSGLLILFFILASLGVIGLTLLVVHGLVRSSHAFEVGRKIPWYVTHEPRILGITAAVVGSIILFSTLFKVYQLRQSGGEGVAMMLGGEAVDPGEIKDPNVRRLMNVVEEMAIASGLSVPLVCILPEEQSINAFAAGYSPDDAVIGVTRGAVDKLTRDELQGVIAHEFSHVFNGDMRLNIRLIGVLHGILILTLTGWALIRGSIAGSSRRGSRREGASFGPIQFVFLGIGLVIIGFIGGLFGHMIKAALSRQREFLADASSVQFTRNPDGLSGALKKIGGLGVGSILKAPKAEIASHMYFAPGLTKWFDSIFTTHPPLTERIRRIDPSWDGEITPFGARTRMMTEAEERGALRLAPEQAALAAAASGSALNGIGRIDVAHIDYANEIMRSIPQPIKEASHKPILAKALVYTLLLDPDPAIRSKQETILRDKEDHGLLVKIREFSGLLTDMDPKIRLPIIDLSLPALKKQFSTLDHYHDFKDTVEALIQADHKVNLFEWTLKIVLKRHVEGGLLKPVTGKFETKTVKTLENECTLLLSIIARVGARSQQNAQAAFQAGANALEVEYLQIKPAKECNLKQLTRALEALEQLSPIYKRRLIGAVAAAISYDQTVSVKEGELLRAISDSLGCSMPPLLPGQRLL